MEKDHTSIEKGENEYIEDTAVGYNARQSDLVVDKDAQGYTDADVHIDAAENRRLRWLVHKR